MSKIINYPHVAQMAFNKPLLATAELANLVTSFLQARITKGNNEQQVAASSASVIPLGAPEEGKGLMVVPVHGILVPRRFEMQACEELMSFELLRTQINKGMNDDKMSEIVLDINSGGGTAQAAFECAAFIRECAQKKPISAVVNYNACSGAYLVAAACSKIYVSDTSVSGSIGVYQKRLDLTAFYDAEGVNIHTFYRGARKVDFHPDMEMSDDEKAEIENGIEQTYQKFVSAVAQYRGMSEDAVRATEANTFDGARAIELGLADELMSPQDAINSIATRIGSAEASKSHRIQAAHLAMCSQL